jgi:hypothetical protein
MTSPLIIVVGADKGGVGKTTVTRALRAWLETPAFAELPRPRMLDGQFPRGDLVNFCPGAAIINVTDISDQMRIFDVLEGVTIIDIPAGQLGFMLRACDEASLLEDVRSGALRLALLHVLGPSISSLDEIAEATDLLGAAARHFIVKNYINETKFFEWDAASRYAATLRALAGVTIEIPHLATEAAEAVQQAKLPFVDFCRPGTDADGKPRSRTLRGHTAKWLDRTWASFERVGLGTMIRETFEVSSNG